MKAMKKETLATLKANKMKLDNAMIALYVAVMTAVPAIVPALADEQTIIDGISGGTQKVWNILVGIAAPIAAVALGVCAVKMLWGSQKAAEEAKSLAIRIIIAIAIVLLAPALISAVQDWFDKADWKFRY